MPVDGIQGKSNLILLPTGVKSGLEPVVKPIKDTSNGSIDAVNISSRSKEFLRIRRMVDSQPDFRLAKVNSLTKAIDQGLYNMKGEMIADALIRRNLIDLSI